MAFKLGSIPQIAASRLGLSPLGAWDLLHSLVYKFFSVCGKTVHGAKSLPMLGNVVAVFGWPVR